MNKLRVGILGAGWAAQSQVAAFTRQSDVAVTALWNRTRGKAVELANKVEVPTPQIYDHWQDLVEQADIDVLSVATAQWLRREPVIAALERGLHVLIEKPLAIQYDDAKAMVEAAERADTVTALCLTTRYAPGIQAAKQKLQANEIGRLLSFQTGWWLGMKPSALLQHYPWWTDESAVLTGIGAHEFDRVRFLTGGNFTSITGRVIPGVLSSEPTAVLPATYMLMADLNNGITGQLQSTITPGEPRWEIVLYGEGGWIKAKNEQATYQLAGESEPTAIKVPSTSQLSTGISLFQHCWNQLIADFIQAIRNGDTKQVSVPQLPTIVAGLRTQEVVEAAIRAEAERRWININELQS